MVKGVVNADMFDVQEKVKSKDTEYTAFIQDKR